MYRKRHKQIFKAALLTNMEISYWHKNYVGCFSEKNYYIIRCKAPRKRVALIKAETVPNDYILKSVEPVTICIRLS